MRRRRQINVWPAFADLMTVLAVVGLITSVGVLAASRSEVESRPTAGELAAERQAREAAERLAEERRLELEEAAKKLEDLEAASKAAERKIGDLTTELGRNQGLQTAMRRFQGLIDRIAKDDFLRFDPDQSLRLGDELVRFDRNGVEPVWQPGGAEHLRQFCRRLSEEFSSLKGEYSDPASLFTVDVEGHTDDKPCLGGDKGCNWFFSSQRAVAFLEVMRDPAYCPGGSGWRLRPIGLADTRPVPPAPGERPEPVRRISIRVVPDYERWISQGRSGGG
ncbi:MAG: hypothetical protein KDD47_15735 [Acidobacteria bacterium]|nr:hypothetical protein [Acidobacteriota bacterium]